jgi:hypothetical protein
MGSRTDTVAVDYDAFGHTIRCEVVDVAVEHAVDATNSVPSMER